MLPVFRGRTWGFDGPPREVKVLNKHWDQSASPFLEENFGFLSKTFANGMIGRAHTDLFTCTTLITAKSLEDRREGKDPKATHLTSEADVLAALAAPGGPLTLAQLSDWFCPWLDTGDGIGEPGTCVVVGDTAEDRLLFWNMHHRFSRPAFSEMAVLRIPPERAADDVFLEQIKALIRHRGVRGHNNHNDHISLRSCSLDPEALEALAVRLRQGKHYLGVSVSRVADHAAVVPRIPRSGPRDVPHGRRIRRAAGGGERGVQRQAGAGADGHAVAHEGGIAAARLAQRPVDGRSHHRPFPGSWTLCQSARRVAAAPATARSSGR